jgi:hypothetical protein
VLVPVKAMPQPRWASRTMTNDGCRSSKKPSPIGSTNNWNNLQTDFQDGLNLIALIEVLQGRRIGKAFQNPVNQHQMLENVQLALNAIMDDNIKLVNIGKLIN